MMLTNQQKMYLKKKIEDENLPLNFAVVRYRIEFLNWTIDDAMSNKRPYNVHPQTKEYVVDGVTYFGLEELEVAFHVRSWKISSRLKAGWTIDEAIGKIPRNKKGVNKL